MRPRRGHSVIRGFRLNGFDRIAESACACCVSKPPYPAASRQALTVNIAMKPAGASDS
jgi:hypothetical protein